MTIATFRRIRAALCRSALPAAAAAGLTAAISVPIPAVAPAPAAADTGNRTVTSLHTDVEVGSDGSVQVTEEVSYDFEAGEPAPVTRQLPGSASIDGAEERDLGLRGVEVVDDGGAAESDVSEDSDGTAITIGPEGLQGSATVVYRYTYDALLEQEPSDDARLYIDVVGDGWTLPIEEASVQIALPGGAAGASCYAGEPGSTSGCDRLDASGTGVEAAHRSLESGQAMSVDLTFPAAALDGGAESLPAPDYGDGAADTETGDWVILLVVLVGFVFMTAFIVAPTGRRRSTGGSFGGGGGGGGGGAGGGGGGGGGS
ncbi:DUF2207 domain-containing protein [Nocardiopsis coralliicola]